MKNIINAILFLFVISTVFANDAFAVNNPIPGVDIIVKKKPRPDKTLQTDQNGKFSIELEAGEYELNMAYSQIEKVLSSMNVVASNREVSLVLYSKTTNANDSCMLPQPTSPMDEFLVISIPKGGAIISGTLQVNVLAPSIVLTYPEEGKPATFIHLQNTEDTVTNTLRWKNKDSIWYSDVYPYKRKEKDSTHHGFTDAAILFTWQDADTTGAGYTFILKKINEKQTATEAMRDNTALYKAEGVETSEFNVTGKMVSWDSCKNLVWAVEKNGVQSTVGAFKVDTGSFSSQSGQTRAGCAYPAFDDGVTEIYSCRSLSGCSDAQISGTYGSYVIADATNDLELKQGITLLTSGSHYIITHIGSGPYFTLRLLSSYLSTLPTTLYSFTFTLKFKNRGGNTGCPTTKTITFKVTFIKQPAFTASSYCNTGTPITVNVVQNLTINDPATNPVNYNTITSQPIFSGTDPSGIAIVFTGNQFTPTTDGNYTINYTGAITVNIPDMNGSIDPFTGTSTNLPATTCSYTVNPSPVTHTWFFASTTNHLSVVSCNTPVAFGSTSNPLNIKPHCSKSFHINLPPSPNSNCNTSVILASGTKYQFFIIQKSTGFSVVEPVYTSISGNNTFPDYCVTGSQAIIQDYWYSLGALSTTSSKSISNLPPGSYAVYCYIQTPTANCLASGYTSPENFDVVSLTPPTVLVCSPSTSPPSDYLQCCTTKKFKILENGCSGATPPNPFPSASAKFNNYYWVIYKKGSNNPVFPDASCVVTTGSSPTYPTIVNGTSCTTPLSITQDQFFHFGNSSTNNVPAPLYLEDGEYYVNCLMVTACNNFSLPSAWATPQHFNVIPSPKILDNICNVGGTAPSTIYTFSNSQQHTLSYNVSTGLNASNYSWTATGFSISANATSINIPQTPGTYAVSLHCAYGTPVCNIPTNVTVKVLNAPSVAILDGITNANNFSICQGIDRPLSYNPQTSTDLVYNYEWFEGNTSLGSGSPFHTTSLTPGTHTIKLRLSFALLSGLTGCLPSSIESTPLTITVNPIPAAPAILDNNNPAVSPIGATCTSQHTLSYTPVSGCTYTWTAPWLTGTGNTSNSPSITTPTTVNTYTVTLKCTNAAGCTNSTTVSVNVTCPATCTSCNTSTLVTNISHSAYSNDPNNQGGLVQTITFNYNNSTTCNGFLTFTPLPSGNAQDVPFLGAFEYPIPYGDIRINSLGSGSTSVKYHTPPPMPCSMTIPQNNCPCAGHIPPCPYTPPLHLTVKVKLFDSANHSHEICNTTIQLY